MQPHVRVRRGSLLATVVLCTLIGFSTQATHAAEPDLAAIQRQVTAQHDANVQRLKDWIALPSIAAENRNAREGA